MVLGGLSTFEQVIPDAVLVPFISATASSTTVLVASEFQGGDLHHCKSHCLKTNIMFYVSRQIDSMLIA